MENENNEVKNLWSVSLELSPIKISEFRSALKTKTSSLNFVPPTFVSVLNHAGKSSTDLISSLDYSLDQTLHGEETIEYFRVLRIGEVLIGEMSIASIEKKVGKSGNFDVLTILIEYRSEKGEKVVSIHRKLLAKTFSN